MIKSQEQLEKKIQKLGFLPFFKNPIEGYSIEEETPKELWFSDEVDGPWEWKGPIIGNWNCAYGKFFAGKAGFVSLEWLQDFINWRRSIFPFSSYPVDSKHIYEVLTEHESLLSKELKVKSGFTLARKRKLDPFGIETKESRKNGLAFDGLIAQLQMGTHVCIADFEYLISRQGERYGWGVARYCTPEAMYGEQISTSRRLPQESRQRIIDHLLTVVPNATEKKLLKLI